MLATSTSTETPFRLGSLRELACRCEDAITTWLLWDEATGETTVVVADERHRETFSLTVAGGDALDCFRHPFVYLDLSQAAARAGA